MPNGQNYPSDDREGTYFGVPEYRGKVISMLTDAYARDRLEQSEFEHRVERAEAAATIEALDALLSDFPDWIPRTRSTTPEQYGTGNDAERAVMPADAPRHFSLLGDQRFLVGPNDPRALQSYSLLGDVKIDLRGIAGRGGAMLINTVSILGETIVIVPKGCTVLRKYTGVLGEFRTRPYKRKGLLSQMSARLFGTRNKENDDTISDEARIGPQPTVVIKGFKLMGDIIIEEA